jgi:type II secretory pathway component PulJ
MSNQSTNPFEGGRLPTLRSLRIARGVGSLCLMLGLLVCASSAMAAEIMEVRVGRHAEFTRVVFELDRAAGYRIERSDPTSNVEELVISIEASSIPRRIQSSKSLIVQVEIEPSGSRSIARIRLTKDGLRLKEMILASPPRIVLDVFSDRKVTPSVAKIAKPAAKPAAKPKAKPAPTPKTEVVPSFDAPAFEAVVAQIPAAPAPAVKPTPVAEVAEVTDEVVVEVEAELADEVEPLPERVVVVDEPSTSVPIEVPVVVAEVAPEMPAQARPTPVPSTRPMVVMSKPAMDQGSDWMTWALAGVGAIALLLGGVFAARRFSGGDEVDFAEEGENNYDDGARAPLGDEDNPFEGLSGSGPQMTLGTEREGATRASLHDEEKESESVVFGDSEEKSMMDDMEVISRDQVNESLGGMPAAGVEIPEEFQQMMREMNRRVESLEGRIDELVDARDRLERQVAAQTEELRVQRAAIARTQRAVRNLARPEDGEGDQEPTEPALRDPNQPSAE